MKSFDYVVKNPLGIHARPAARIAQTCINFKSEVLLSVDGAEANGSNVLSILRLEAIMGSTVHIQVDGPDEEEAVAAIQAVLNEETPKGKKAEVLKVAFFGTKSYDRLFFSELAKDRGEGAYNVEIKYLKTRLTEDTAELANGYDAVCIVFPCPGI